MSFSQKQPHLKQGLVLCTSLTISLYPSVVAVARLFFNAYDVFALCCLGIYRTCYCYYFIYYKSLPQQNGYYHLNGAIKYINLNYIMNGIVTQLLSMITYGNQFLKNGNVPANYYPANAAFKFCNSVNFIHLNTQADNTTAESIVAVDPPSWFAFLKDENCQELKAFYHPSEGNEQGTPDHKLAGFVGGGGTWLIEAIYPTYSDFWAARWENNQPNNPNRNIWAVSYGRTVSGTDTINFRPDVNEVAKGLKAVLTEIKAFAAHHKLNNWADIFQNALNVLNGQKPIDDFYKDTINETGYSKEALQLVYSAMTAHVFGGMGSWNDIGFEDAEDNKTYDELSFYLYDYINRGLISGINSVKLQ